MLDVIDEAFAALERVEAPVTWNDVLTREVGGEPLELPAPLRTRDDRPTRRRRLSVVLAAAVLLIVVIAVLAVRSDDEVKPSGVSATGAPAPNPLPTPTTELATRATRTGAVSVWTGDRYLVWGGEAGTYESSARADGWTFDPATGKTADVPVAPIAPRYGAAGVWTGDELIVCCGAAIGAGPEYDTGTAAAYRPDDHEWRRLAGPPAGSVNAYSAAVWTGEEMIVTFGTGADSSFGGRDDVTPAAIAYNPETDAWRTLAAPPLRTRAPEAEWTGSEVIVWDSVHGAVDQGFAYDPGADTWTPLPGLPEGSRTSNGSMTWTGDEVVVYGPSADDHSKVAAARWRPGDATWRPVRDPGLPPIDWFEGTPGSQSLAWDATTQRLVVSPVQGNESFQGPQPLLVYDPARDTWRTLDTGSLGYSPGLVAADGGVFRPDRDHPLVTRTT